MARSTATLFACLVVLVAVMAIILPVSIHFTRKNESPNKNAEDPEKVGRKACITEKISFFFQGNIDDPSSAHGRALSWVLGVNNLMLDSPGMDSLIKLRFTMAAFFFATDGERWLERGNFLSDNHVCEWNKEQVVCDDDMEVTEFQFGEFFTLSGQYLSRI